MRQGVNIAVHCLSDPRSLSRCVNKIKEIRSGIGPLTENSGNIVADSQRIANALNSYFASIFNSNSADTVVVPNTI